VEAILDSRKMLGCCSHDACMPGVGSAMCSQRLATSLQPCMQKDYGGNRAHCVTEVVVLAAPAVCDHGWESCEGLRSLTKYLQLAQAVSGCPSREGMVSIGAYLGIIFAAPLALQAAATAFFTPAVSAGATIATPLLSAAAFPSLIPGFISAETSTDFQLSASVSAATGIVLVGGTSPWQGNVFAKDAQGRWGAVCGNHWTLANAHVVCQQLGKSQAIKFYGSPSFAITPPVDGPGSRYGDLPFGFVYALERVSCAGTESRLMDCPVLTTDAVLSICDATTVAGVECV